MKRFEYASTELKGHGGLSIQQIQEHLTQVGADGWELVCQFRHHRGHIEFTFKREIVETESDFAETENASGIEPIAFAAFDALSAGVAMHEAFEAMIENYERENAEQVRERVIEAFLRSSGPLELVRVLEHCSENTFSEVNEAIGKLLVDRVLTHCSFKTRYGGAQGYKLTVGAGGPVVRRRLKPATETFKAKPHFFGVAEPDSSFTIHVQGRPLDDAPKYWIALSRDRFDDRPVVGMHAEQDGDGWVLVVYHE